MYVPHAGKEKYVVVYDVLYCELDTIPESEQRRCANLRARGPTGDHRLFRARRWSFAVIAGPRNRGEQVTHWHVPCGNSHVHSLNTHRTTYSTYNGRITRTKSESIQTSRKSKPRPQTSPRQRRQGWRKAQKHGIIIY